MPEGMQESHSRSCCAAEPRYSLCAKGKRAFAAGTGLQAPRYLRWPRAGRVSDEASVGEVWKLFEQQVIPAVGCRTVRRQNSRWRLSAEPPAGGNSAAPIRASIPAVADGFCPIYIDAVP